MIRAAVFHVIKADAEAFRHEARQEARPYFADQIPQGLLLKNRELINRADVVARHNHRVAVRDGRGVGERDGVLRLDPEAGGVDAAKVAIGQVGRIASRANGCGSTHIRI